MPPMPHPAARRLVDEINERASQGEISEFEIARFQREAKKLLSVDRVNANVALGILAALQNDIPAMRRHHQAAIVASGNSNLQQFNYASSLGYCHLYDEALDIFKRLHEQSPLDLNYLDLLIRALYGAGHVQEALGYLKEWDKITDDEHFLALDIAEDAADEADIAEALDEAARGEVVSWDDVKAELNLH